MQRECSCAVWDQAVDCLVQGQRTMPCSEYRSVRSLHSAQQTGYTHTHTHTLTDRQTDRQTDRHAHTRTHTHTSTHTPLARTMNVHPGRVQQDPWSTISAAMHDRYEQSSSWIRPAWIHAAYVTHLEKTSRQNGVSVNINARWMKQDSNVFVLQAPKDLTAPVPPTKQPVSEA